MVQSMRKCNGSLDLEQQVYQGRADPLKLTLRATKQINLQTEQYFGGWASNSHCTSKSVAIWGTSSWFLCSLYGPILGYDLSAHTGIKQERLQNRRVLLIPGFRIAPLPGNHLKVKHELSHIKVIYARKTHPYRYMYVCMFINVNIKNESKSVKCEC